MGNFGFGLGKILILIAMVLILWTIWSPDYLEDNLGLDDDSVDSFTEVMDPFKFPITLIAMGTVLWAGYSTVKGSV